MARFAASPRAAAGRRRTATNQRAPVPRRTKARRRCRGGGLPLREPFRQVEHDGGAGSVAVGTVVNPPLLVVVRQQARRAVADVVEVLGALRRHHDHCRRAVVLQAAVVQVEGFDDPARGVVLRLVQRTAVHHGAGIGLSMMAGRERNRPQRLLAHTEGVHEALHLHGEGLRRRRQAVGRRVGGGAKQNA